MRKIKLTDDLNRQSTIEIDDSPGFESLTGFGILLESASFDLGYEDEKTYLGGSHVPLTMHIS